MSMADIWKTQTDCRAFASRSWHATFVKGKVSGILYTWTLKITDSVLHSHIRVKSDVQGTFWLACFVFHQYVYIPIHCCIVNSHRAKNTIDRKIFMFFKFNNVGPRAEILVSIHKVLNQLYFRIPIIFQNNMFWGYRIGGKGWGGACSKN